MKRSPIPPPWKDAFPARFWKWDDVQRVSAEKRFYGGNQRRIRRRISWAEQRKNPAADTLSGDWGEEAWRVWLDEVDWSAEADGLLAGDFDEIPFGPLLMPLVAAAQREVAAPFLALRPPVRQGLARMLSGRLSGLSHRALFDHFQSWRAGADGEVYSAFTRRWREGGAMRFLTVECPALGCLLATACAQWADEIARVLQRLKADATQLARLLGAELGAGDLVEVVSGEADAHEGGKMIIIFKLSACRGLVYKPRGVAMEAALATYLEGVADLSPALNAPATEVLACSDEAGAYGWAVWIKSPTEWSTGELTAYYERAGALLFQMTLLGGCDLHMENVIARADGPVVIDGECLLQPRGAGIGGGSMVRALRDSGLLSEANFQRSPAGAADCAEIGGLLGEGGHRLPVKKRCYRFLNTAEMEVHDEEEAAPAHPNIPRSRAGCHRLADHLEAFLSGFRVAWEEAMSHRGALAELLEAFAGQRSRFLPRATSAYGEVLLALVQPQALRCERTAGLALESLLAPGFRTHSLPPPDALLEAEASCLLRMDIPVFHVSTNGRDLFAGEEKLVVDVVDQSGLDAARARLNGLDSLGLETCTQAIRRSIQGCADAEATAGGGPRLLRRTEMSLSARTLHQLADAVGDGVRRRLAALGEANWEQPDLYHGEPGAALFLAAAGQCLDRESDLQLAAELLDAGCDRPFREGAEWGAVTGRASLLLALGSMAVIHGDRRWQDRAEVLAAELSRASEQHLLENDLLAGRAGWVAVVAEWVRCFPSRADTWRSHLEWAEQALIAAAERGPQGRPQWRGADGRVMQGGFAHGAAGVAVALARSARFTGRRDAAETALAAWETEQEAFDPILGNWMFQINALGQRVGMNAWCNGISGMALALSETLATTAVASPELERLLESIAPQVCDPSFSPIDHVCCGNAGRLAICDTLARREQGVGAGFVSHAEDLFLRHGEGSAGFQLDDEEGWLGGASFFRGLSGIGYSLMRLREPSLPDVVALRLD